jgi:hypothetical protein
LRWFVELVSYLWLNNKLLVVTGLKELGVGVWWKEYGSQGALLDAEDRNRESILEVALHHVTFGVFNKKNEVRGLLSWASDHNVGLSRY